MQTPMSLMQGAPAAPKDQVTLANWREPGFGRWSFSHIRQLLPTAPIAPASSPAPMARAIEDLAAVPIMHDGAASFSLDGFLRHSQTDAYLVMHRGKLVYEWYDGFGSADRQHIVFSVSKSITALLAGVLVGQGVLHPDQMVADILPETKGSAYDGATVRNVLDMTVSSGFVEDYLDTTGVFMAYRRASAWNPLEEGTSTDGLRAFLAALPAGDGNHGHQHDYCSPHSDLLGWLLERAAGQSFASLLSTLIAHPTGLAHEAYVTLDSYGAPRVAGGICVTPVDLVRLAEMVRCGGAANGRQVVPESWITDFTTYDNDAAWQRQKEGPRLFDRGCYRSKWYRTGHADDEYCAIGIHGQWIWVNPKRDISIVRLASADLPLNSEMDRVLLSAFDATCQALA